MFSHLSDPDVSDSSQHFCWWTFTINALISCTQTVPELASCFCALCHHHHHHRHHHDHHNHHDDHDHHTDHDDHDHHFLHHLFNILIFLFIIVNHETTVAIYQLFFKGKQLYLDLMPRIVVRDLLARRSDLRPPKFEVGMGQDWIVCVPCIFNYCMSWSWSVHIRLHQECDRRPNFVGAASQLLLEFDNLLEVWEISLNVGQKPKK